MKFLRLFFIAVAALSLVVPVSSVQSAAVKKTNKAAVVAKKKVLPPKPAPPKRVAQLLLASANELKLSPGESVNVRFGFKNTGKLGWKQREIRLVGGDGSSFASESWVNTSTPVRANAGEVKVGRLEFFDFVIVAPNQVGTYQIKAAVFADGEVVTGGSISIPVEVANDESEAIVSDVLLPEPRIRVSLGKVTDSRVPMRVSVGQYSVNLLDGTPVGVVNEGDEFALSYDETSKVYSFEFGGSITTSTIAFRILGSSPDARFILKNKKDAASWNKSVVYNEYRDTFELRWSDKIVGLWMINELPMEHYLKGLVETGNSEPYELQKAVYTAARTYAYIYLPEGDASMNRMWDVHSVWDQVYKGYAAERTNPNGVRAVDETRGVVVTFEHRPVVTPYFTRSNGYTRGWREVWGGKDKPWLVPVAAPYDVGKKMLGHGVGMSTLDAKNRVQKDGWNFNQVLTYYYSGVVLQKIYE